MWPVIPRELRFTAGLEMFLMESTRHDQQWLSAVPQEASVLSPFSVSTPVTSLLISHRVSSTLLGCSLPSYARLSSSSLPVRFRPCLPACRTGWLTPTRLCYGRPWTMTRSDPFGPSKFSCPGKPSSLTFSTTLSHPAPLRVLCSSRH